MKHDAFWTAPPPFWSETLQSDPGFHRPRLLRFATDAFMEEFTAILKNDPRDLTGLEAEHETWRNPTRRDQAIQVPHQTPVAPKLSGIKRLLRDRRAATNFEAIRPQTLKLYQPAHQRHYMVAASLLCRRPGLPERAVDRSRQQSVSFVLRRLVKLPLPDTYNRGDALEAPVVDEKTGTFHGWTECAWIAGAAPHWQAVGDGTQTELVAGEERLPLFPAAYQDVHNHARRLFMGTVPVGRRESYQSGKIVETATLARASNADDEVEARTKEGLRRRFLMEVGGPWMALSDSARPNGGQPTYFAELSPDAFKEKADATKALADHRGRLQVGAWYVLLALREFIDEFGSDSLKTMIASGGPLADEGSTAASKFAFHLQGMATKSEAMSKYDTLLSANLFDALHRIQAFQPLLDNPRAGADKTAARPDFKFDPSTLPSQPWPDFLFFLSDPEYGDLPMGEFSLADSLAQRLDLLFAGLFPCLKTNPVLPLSTASTTRASDPRDGWYCIRMAMEHPECLHVHREVLSEPTTPFQMAGFYDADAPARPIRIALPIDPTPAGLRKFDRNTVLELSDLMCSHASRMRSLTFGDLVLSVLPWPFHKDLPGPGPGKCDKGNDMGMMLVLSIPIITICALILLMIIVALLDAVFYWLPLFLFWIPVPKKKAG